MVSRPRRFALLALGCACSALSGVPAQEPAARDRLRSIVQQECLPHWRRSGDPAPCSSVTLLDPTPEPAGYAVLADRKGGAHFLLIPTRTISGIESDDARAPGGPNYFAAAWQARGVLAQRLGREPPREAIALAVNHQDARSQDQLHVHISCIEPAVHEVLGREAERIGMHWGPIAIGSWRYQARRISGAELGLRNPFRLLAEGLSGAARAMGQYTLLVAGMDFREGPGFIVLAGTSVPGAELLLDPACSAAGVIRMGRVAVSK